VKRIALVSGICLALTSVASADQVVQDMYRDLIRPHGRPRGAAVSQAALDYCYNKTGDVRGLADTPAFKKCMLTQGYRWTRIKVTGPATDDSAPDLCDSPGPPCYP
jgi:hypothetical protein